MNKERLLELADRLEANHYFVGEMPVEFDMGTWGIVEEDNNSHACKTSACIAGHAYILFGPHDVLHNLIKSRNYREYGDMMERSSSWAGKWLELNERDEQLLFLGMYACLDPRVWNKANLEKHFPNRNSYYEEEGVIKIGLAGIPLMLAVHCLRHAAETGTISWKAAAKRWVKDLKERDEWIGSASNRTKGSTHSSDTETSGTAG